MTTTPLPPIVTGPTWTIVSARVELAAGELVGLGDAHDLLDAVQHLKVARQLRRQRHADDADDRPLLAAREVGLQAEMMDALDDVVDLGLGAKRAHDDDHGRAPPVGRRFGRSRRSRAVCRPATVIVARSGRSVDGLAQVDVLDLPGRLRSC